MIRFQRTCLGLKHLPDRFPEWSPPVCFGCRSPVNEILNNFFYRFSNVEVYIRRNTEQVLVDGHGYFCSVSYLWQLSNFHCNLADVGGVELKALSVGGRLRLVPENNVGKWQHRRHLVLEELKADIRKVCKNILFLGPGFKKDVQNVNLGIEIPGRGKGRRGWGNKSFQPMHSALRLSASMGSTPKLLWMRCIIWQVLKS